MIAFDSKARIKDIQPCFRVRVSDSHPLDLNIGRNENGVPYLLMIGSFTIKKIAGTSSISVIQDSDTDGKSRLCFLLTDPQYIDNFYKFIDDMVIASSDICDPSTGYSFLTGRFLSWKKTFGISKSMSVSEVQGLIGELLFLSRFAIDKYGDEEAIKGWSGTEKTTKDFSYSDSWYEVKTTSNNERTVTITNLEQLESNQNGILVAYILDKRSNIQTDINLIVLVESLNKKLSSIDAKILFREKLLDAGYRYGDDSNAVYSGTNFEMIDESFYKVNDTFPRLLRNSIDSRIQDVSYKINLNKIADLKIAKEDL